MKQLWFKYRKLGLISLFFISLTSAIHIGFEFLKGTLLDAAVKKSSSRLFSIVFILFIAVTIKAITHYLYSKNFKVLMVRGLADIRYCIMSGLLKRSYPEYMERKTGEYLSIYTNQLDTIEWSYFNSIYGLLQISTEVIFALMVLIIIDWRLSILATVLLMPTVFFPWLIKHWIDRTQQNRLQCINKHIGRFTEWVRGVEIIKNYGSEQRFSNLFCKDSDKVEKSTVQYGHVEALSRSISALLTQFSFIGMIFASAGLVLSHQLSVGMFFAVIGIMEQLQTQVIHIAAYTQMLMSARVAIKTVKEIVELPVNFKGGEESIESVCEITFDKVAYSYPDIPERKIINDFDWRVKDKGIYIISGESGSGKSTLMNLLQNYYSVDEGEITINGIEVDNICNLTEIITIMRQEATFFEDSLRNNLTMYESIPDAKIFQLMNQLGLEKYAKLEALNSIVVNGGASYSGGEARRFSLLRCILKKSDILILDEPLANVDPLSIEKIVDVILQLSIPYIFVISHQSTDNLEVSCIKHIHLSQG